MTDTRKLNEPSSKALDKIERGQQVSVTALFTGLLGSNINPVWFDWLLKNLGNYLFTGALFLFLVKFAVDTYRFITAPNKNVTETGNFAWSVLQTAIIGVSIVGAIAAAATFVLLTPALFVGSLALDTLRNVGLLAWNIIKLGLLEFAVRKKDPDDLIRQINKEKYDKLHNEYLDNIKKHSLFSVISLVMTAAVGVIMLFPHIGLGAIAATAFTVGAVKLTVAGIAGIAASAALSAPFLPLIGKGIKYLASKIGKKSLTEENKKPGKEEIEEEKPLLHESSPAQLAEQSLPRMDPKNTKYMITDEDALDNALNHELSKTSAALAPHSRQREVVLDHIDDDDPELAQTAMVKMLDKKILEMMAFLDAKGFFADLERYKRQQKLLALLIIKQILENKTDVTYMKEGKPETITDIPADYLSVFAQNELKNLQYQSLEFALDYIKTNLSSGVNASFMLGESDTLNIVRTAEKYNTRFIEKPSSKTILTQ